MFFRKKSINTSEAEQIAISSLLKLLRENDILEIELLLNGKIVKIGFVSYLSDFCKQFFAFCSKIHTFKLGIYLDKLFDQYSWSA